MAVVETPFFLFSGVQLISKCINNTETLQVEVAFSGVSNVVVK